MKLCWPLPLPNSKSYNSLRTWQLERKIIWFLFHFKFLKKNQFFHLYYYCFKCFLFLICSLWSSFALASLWHSINLVHLTPPVFPLTPRVTSFLAYIFIYYITLSRRKGEGEREGGGYKRRGRERKKEDHLQWTLTVTRSSPSLATQRSIQKCVSFKLIMPYLVKGIYWLHPLIHIFLSYCYRSELCFSVHY